MISGDTLTGIAATALFCLAFLRGRDVHLMGARGHRAAVSIAGGAAVAYVFIRLSPELQKAAAAFREATSHLEMRVLDLGVALATMFGFLLFYGVEELVIRSRDADERQKRREAGASNPLFLIHMMTFTAYAWIITYLVAHAPEPTVAGRTLYAVAMGLHFVSVAHALREEHGRAYDGVGAPVLAAGCAAGWVCGLTVALPAAVVAILLGFVAGGIIANTVISELPREKQGRFLPFALGAVTFSALLVLIG